VHHQFSNSQGAGAWNSSAFIVSNVPLIMSMTVSMSTCAFSFTLLHLVASIVHKCRVQATVRRRRNRSNEDKTPSFFLHVAAAAPVNGATLDDFGVAAAQGRREEPIQAT
jgi:hypothetical protein